VASWLAWQAGGLEVQQLAPPLQLTLLRQKCKPQTP
jgi:hypothetical protein